MSPRRRPVRAEQDGSVLRWPGATAKFELFAEVLWTGILMAVVCIPVITWPAAIAAGTSHLRRHVRAESSPVSGFFRDVRGALPGALGVGAVTTLLAALLGLDLALAAGGVMPGGMPVAIVAGVVGVVVVTASVIAASAWTPGARWSGLVRSAPPAIKQDVPGAVMTFVAIGLAVVVTWQFAPLGIPALGLVAFALVAVSERRLARRAAAEAG